jgi:hypothetical protein
VTGNPRLLTTGFSSRREGFEVAAGEEEVFTMANYADGYEIWIRVEATDKSLPVRSAA